MTGSGHPKGWWRERRVACVFAMPLVSLSLVGCGADATDFRVSAEAFIEGDTMAEQAGTEFRGAACEQPDDTRPGTAFGCEAVSVDGATWEFEVVIVDDSNFEISGRATGAG